jgi:hypothetical protein
MSVKLDIGEFRFFEFGTQILADFTSLICENLRRSAP